MTRLITTDDLKNNTVIEKNVQADLLVPYIDIAQALYVKRILGVAQYDNIVNDVAANTTSGGTINITALTTSNQALIVQIAPALSFCAFYEGMPFIWAKFTNKGISLKSSIENDTSTVKLNEMQTLRKTVFDWSQFYLEELKQWLRNNHSNYPLWREDIFYQKDFLSGSTSNTRYFSGIQFDNDPYYDSRQWNKNDIRRFISGSDL